MIFKRMAGLTVGALLLMGGGAAAHAQVCYDANCLIQQQEANDPAYQAAIHGGYGNGYGYSSMPYSQNYGYGVYPNYSYANQYNPYQPLYSSYGYPQYGQYPYSQMYSTLPMYQTYSNAYTGSAPYNYQYQYAYQYQYQPSMNVPAYNSYGHSGCLYTIHIVQGTVVTTCSAY